VFGRIRFILSFSSIIDIASTIPSFIALCLVAERVVISGFIAATHYDHIYALAAWRLVRLLRLFRLQESTRTLRTIGLVFYRRSADLMTAFFIIFFLLLLMSVVMFYVEKDVQPEKFESILRSFYFTTVTLFTVGYGDVTAQTGVGKFFVVCFIASAFIFMR
jgi:voltage-gated potassium channel